MKMAPVRLFQSWMKRSIVYKVALLRGPGGRGCVSSIVVWLILRFRGGAMSKACLMGQSWSCKSVSREKCDSDEDFSLMPDGAMHLPWYWVMTPRMVSSNHAYNLHRPEAVLFRCVVYRHTYLKGIRLLPSAVNVQLIRRTRGCQLKVHTLKKTQHHGTLPHEAASHDLPRQNI